MDMSKTYLKKAEEVVNSAIALDHKGFSKDAVQAYMKALEWFEMAAKYEPVGVTRVRIQEKMAMYVRRVEALKAPDELLAMPKTYVPKHLRPQASAQKSSEPKPSEPNQIKYGRYSVCGVCRKLLKDLSKCHVCNELCCPGCMHICELCNNNVCDKDLDRTVVGNVCVSHSSPKEIQPQQVNIKEIQPISGNTISTNNNVGNITFSEQPRKLVVQPVVRARETRPKTERCIVCRKNKLLESVSKCVVCNEFACHECMYSCEICYGSVCDNDIDKKSVPAVCVTHRLPKQIQPKIVEREVELEIIKPVEIQSVEIKHEIINPIVQDDEKLQDDEKSKEQECIICLEVIVNNTAVIPCGHMKFCQECLMPYDKCPTCRGPKVSVLRVYG